MLDFPRIKEIKLTDVLARYKIPLRFRQDYAVCACPLPTHKPGDNSKSFSINLAGNYWRCFSDSCNANNSGKRGGDESEEDYWKRLRKNFKSKLVESYKAGQKSKSAL
jgi:hypothetical protein